MASALPCSVLLGNQPISGVRHPLALTCLQWDGDGSLNDEDRVSLLENLAAGDVLGIALSRPFWECDI